MDRVKNLIEKKITRSVRQQYGLWQVNSQPHLGPLAPRKIQRNVTARNVTVQLNEEFKIKRKKCEKIIHRGCQL